MAAFGSEAFDQLRPTIGWNADAVWEALVIPLAARDVHEIE